MDLQFANDEKRNVPPAAGDMLYKKYLREYIFFPGKI